MNIRPIRALRAARVADSSKARSTPPPESPFNTAAGGVFLGSDSWVEQMRERLAQEPADANVPLRRRLAARPTRQRVLEAVKSRLKSSSGELGDARRRGNDARSAAIYLLRRLTDESVSSLAAEFGGVGTSAISMIVRRSESRRRRDTAWDKLLRDLEAECQAPR